MWHGCRSSWTERGGGEGHKNLILPLLLFSAYYQSVIISCHGSSLLNELRGHWISAPWNLDYSAMAEPPHWNQCLIFFLSKNVTEIITALIDCLFDIQIIKYKYQLFADNSPLNSFLNTFFWHFYLKVIIWHLSAHQLTCYTICLYKTWSVIVTCCGFRGGLSQSKLTSCWRWASCLLYEHKSAINHVI